MGRGCLRAAGVLPTGEDGAEAERLEEGGGFVAGVSLELNVGVLGGAPGGAMVLENLGEGLELSAGREGADDGDGFAAAAFFFALEVDPSARPCGPGRLGRGLSGL